MWCRPIGASDAAITTAFLVMLRLLCNHCSRINWMIRGDDFVVLRYFLVVQH